MCIFYLYPCPCACMEEAGFMTNTKSSHQGAIKTFGFTFRSCHVVNLYVHSMWWQHEKYILSTVNNISTKIWKNLVTWNICSEVRKVISQPTGNSRCSLSLKGSKELKVRINQSLFIKSKSIGGWWMCFFLSFPNSLKAHCSRTVNCSSIIVSTQAERSETFLVFREHSEHHTLGFLGV